MTRDHRLLIIYIIVVIALFRLLLLGMYPLMDTTEARYAEIARKMVETGDWITPWFDTNIPFWGKPPLSFWATAISFKIFGINEFAARFPHFFVGVCIAYFTMKWTCRERDDNEALYSIAILSGSLLFLISSGLVMTDMWLLLATTLTMYGFWNALHSPQGSSHWYLIAGASIGLLAKGPISLVLSGAPCFAWMVAQGSYKNVYTKIPWMKVVTATTLFAAPWYILAEIKTPGFLEYFIVGEHVNRFLVPGWEGDLYGSAHDHPKGTIWIFLLIDFLPWTAIVPLLVLIALRKEKLRSLAQDDRSWAIYLLSWSMAPAVFFTLAGNILWPYVLPAFPAMAMLSALLINRVCGLSTPTKLKFISSGLAFSLMILLSAFSALQFTELVTKKSAKEIVDVHIQKIGEKPLCYIGKRSYAIEFYTSGNLESSETTTETMNVDTCDLIVKSRNKDSAQKVVGKNFELVDSRGNYFLFTDNSR